MSPLRSRILLVPLLLAIAPPVALLHAAPVIVQERRVALEIDVVLVEKDSGRSVGTFALEVSPAKGDSIEMAIPWPDAAGGPGSLRITATAVHSAGEAPEVALDAVLALRSGREVRASRNASLPEGGTTLFEVFADGATSLVLSIQGERVLRPVVQEPAGARPRVRFQVAIERVDGERSVPVETNELSSLLGEGVEYSFGRGTGGDAEAVRLVLTLERIDGDLAEVKADISASLPGPDGATLLSRGDRVFATRGATSTVLVVTGDPPAGYRFLITPLF